MTINHTSERAKTGRPTAGPSRGGPSRGLEDVLLPTPTTDDAGNITRDSGNFQSLTRTATTLLPTPNTGTSPNGHGRRGGKVANGHQSGASLDAIAALLPTPDVGGGGKTIPDDAVWSGKAAYKPDGTKVQVNVENAILRAVLLPTPTVTDHKASGSTQAVTDTHHAGTTLTDATVRQSAMFGQYAPAIARWEAVLGRTAPAPTEPNAAGNQRLSARFVEWMMGLPEGHVVDVPGITRNQALKALGNGVVPQQAAHAIRRILAAQEVAA